MNWLPQLIFGSVFLLGATLLALITLIVPLHAHRRGHGFWSWFLLQFFAFNPVYALILAASLPNKARMRLRDQFTLELDERLDRALGRPGADSPRTRSATSSVGDRPTEGSIGDVPTIG